VYKENIEKLIKNVWFIVPVILTTILSFGYVVNNTAISVDTLSGNRYFSEGELIAQGRFTATLIHKIFNVMEFNPFFVDTLAVVFLVISSIVMCSLFMTISQGKIKDIAYTIFSCIFVSYPLINEIFVYTPAGLSVGIGYFMIAVSLILMYEMIKNNKKINIIISIILVCFAISLYESFAAVYLCGAVMVVILNYIYSDSTHEKTFKRNLKYAIVLLIVVIVAVILNSVIGKVLKSVLNIASSGNAAKTITYSSMGLIGGIKTLIKTTIKNYVLGGLYYLPLTSLMIAMLGLVVLIIISTIKKRYLLSFMYIALIITTFSLSIIQGLASPYRTCQTFGLVIGFVLMIFAQEILLCNRKIWVKNLLITLIFILVFYQAKDLHKWFYLNNLRYEEEKNIVISIGNKLESEHDTTKPVIFTGGVGVSNKITEATYLKSNTVSAKIIKKVADVAGVGAYDFNAEYILKYPETNVNSYLAWALYAFPLDKDANPELIKMFNYFGYDIKGADKKMYNRAVEENKDMKKWPKKGSIVETEEYILVML